MNCETVTEQSKLSCPSCGTRNPTEEHYIKEGCFNWLCNEYKHSRLKEQIKEFRKLREKFGDCFMLREEQLFSRRALLAMNLEYKLRYGWIPYSLCPYDNPPPFKHLLEDEWVMSNEDLLLELVWLEKRGYIQ